LFEIIRDGLSGVDLDNEIEYDMAVNNLMSEGGAWFPYKIEITELLSSIHIDESGDWTIDNGYIIKLPLQGQTTAIRITSSITTGVGGPRLPSGDTIYPRNPGSVGSVTIDNGYVVIYNGSNNTTPTRFDNIEVTNNRTFSYPHSVPKTGLRAGSDGFIFVDKTGQNINLGGSDTINFAHRIYFGTIQENPSSSVIISAIEEINRRLANPSNSRGSVLQSGRTSSNRTFQPPFWFWAYPAELESTTNRPVITSGSFILGITRFTFSIPNFSGRSVSMVAYCNAERYTVPVIVNIT